MKIRKYVANIVKMITVANTSFKIKRSELKIGVYDIQGVP